MYITCRHVYSHPFSCCSVYWHVCVTSQNVQPIPLGVTFSNAVSKLKAPTSLFTETWQKRHSTFELWAFENVIPRVIGYTSQPIFVIGCEWDWLYMATYFRNRLRVGLAIHRNLLHRNLLHRNLLHRNLDVWRTHVSTPKWDWLYIATYFRVAMCTDMCTSHVSFMVIFSSRMSSELTYDNQKETDILKNQLCSYFL